VEAELAVEFVHRLVVDGGDGVDRDDVGSFVDEPEQVGGLEPLADASSAVADLFCGVGVSSLGAGAGGGTLAMARTTGRPRSTCTRRTCRTSPTTAPTSAGTVMPAT